MSQHMETHQAIPHNTTHQEQANLQKNEPVGKKLLSTLKQRECLRLSLGYRFVDLFPHKETAIADFFGILDEELDADTDWPAIFAFYCIALRYFDISRVVREASDVYLTQIFEGIKPILLGPDSELKTDLLAIINQSDRTKKMYEEVKKYN